jgi:hypothetical protein
MECDLRDHSRKLSYLFDKYEAVRGSICPRNHVIIDRFEYAECSSDQMVVVTARLVEGHDFVLVPPLVAGKHYEVREFRTTLDPDDPDFPDWQPIEGKKGCTSEVYRVYGVWRLHSSQYDDIESKWFPSVDLARQEMERMDAKEDCYGI